MSAVALQTIPLSSATCTYCGVTYQLLYMGLPHSQAPKPVILTAPFVQFETEAPLVLEACHSICDIQRFP